MAKDHLLLIGLGVGALYLLSKPNVMVSSTPQTYPVPGGTNAGGIPILGSLLPSIFGPNGSYTVSQIPRATGGAVDVTNINQIGPQPAPVNMTDYSGGCVSNGDVCDPNDCSYSPDVCAEMSGTTLAGWLL